MNANDGWKWISLLVGEKAINRLETLKNHSWANLYLETGALYQMSYGTSLDILLGILNAVMVQISVSLQDRFEANVVKRVQHFMQFC